MRHTRIRVTASVAIAAGLGSVVLIGLPSAQATPPGSLSCVSGATVQCVAALADLAAVSAKVDQIESFNGTSTGDTTTAFTGLVGSLATAVNESVTTLAAYLSASIGSSPPVNASPTLTENLETFVNSQTKISQDLADISLATSALPPGVSATVALSGIRGVQAKVTTLATEISVRQGAAESAVTLNPIAAVTSVGTTVSFTLSTNKLLCAASPTGCITNRYASNWIDDESTPSTTAGTLAPLVTINTNSYPTAAGRTAPTGSGINFSGLIGARGGQGGVDISLSNASVQSGAAYVPCKASPSTEPYKPACASATAPSYQKTLMWTSSGTSGNPLPNGYLLGNSTTVSGTAYNHLWGKKTTAIAVEFYPGLATDITTTDANYVRPRFGVGASDIPATPGGNGYNMTVPWGSITEVYLGDPDPNAQVGTLGGTVYTTVAGVEVPDTTAGALSYSIFQSTPDNTTTTGKGVLAFSSGTSGATGGYNTGAMYAGDYELTVRDTSNPSHSVIFSPHLFAQGQAANFYLDRTCFGRTDYTSCSGW